MRKQIKLASGLGALVALIAVSGSPAYAGWVRRGDSIPSSVNARDTTASLAATDTTARRYDGTPTVVGNVVMFYDWVVEPGDPEIPAAQWSVTRFLTCAGTAIPRINDDEVTGSGDSIASITTAGVTTTAWHWSDDAGNIHRIPANVPASTTQTSNFAVYVDEDTGKPTLNLSSPISVSAYSQETSRAWSENTEAVRGGGRGNPGTAVIHNLAPGTARTLSAKVSSGGFGFSPLP